MTYGFSFVDGPISWRFPLAFQLIFMFILFATVPWLPESPRWLIAHGREDEAQKILADLESLEADDSYIVTEVKEISFAVQVRYSFFRSQVHTLTDAVRERTCHRMVGSSSRPNR
jgi:hypothetical protein